MLPEWTSCDGPLVRSTDCSTLPLPGRAAPSGVTEQPAAAVAHEGFARPTVTEVTIELDDPPVILACPPDPLAARRSRGSPVSGGLGGTPSRYPAGAYTHHDGHDRERAPPMLPQRAETVSAFASSPENADEHQQRPDRVADATHTAILGVGGGPSRAPAGTSACDSRARRERAPVAKPRQHRDRIIVRGGPRSASALDTMEDGLFRSRR